MCTILNVLKLPLHGTSLIEASAGTGKTYTLIIIYIRLLLGLGNTSDFCRPLTVREILVVTFTKSAVQNLRYRIRTNIHQFRLDCVRRHSNNVLFSQLLSQICDMELAITQLIEAEHKIDQASIFTIHGFCQKILNYSSIELNMLFNTTIIDNETTLYQQTCADFWRRNFYSLPLNIVSLIQKYWKDPNSLLNEILPYIYYPTSNICDDNVHTQKNIIAYYEQIIIYINNIKKNWNINKCNIIPIIYEHAVNRRIYNKKNLIRWIHTINQWTEQPTIDHTIPNDLQYFRSSQLRVYKNYETDHHIYSLFDIIEKLYRKLLLFKSLILDIAINEIRTELYATRFLRQEITFNEVIDVLLRSLMQDKENRLVHIIRTRYPIAMIDEFQDTDQQQYKIFHILYFNCLKNGLILIGDPKQSIYAFRGADIFAYMKIRHTICNKYTLNTNWRSSSGIVNAVNTLFQSISHPFVFNEIPFIPSVTVNKNNTYKFSINNKLQNAMCFWLHPDEIVARDDYKQAMAKECAIVLNNLLHEIYNEKAWLENEIHKRKLQTSDITILVRNHEEALLISNALSKVNISTMFLSSNKNIFETIESYELLLLLQSILFPEYRTICTALTTVFFGLNTADIELINNNESEWEKMLEKFFEYHFIWKKQGIFSMIQKIIFDYKIPEKLLSTQRGETSLINILHLGELLQDVAMQLHNEYALMDWLILKTTQPQNRKTYDYALRLRGNHKLIKISTIHKSKGLEFPLTFLPFIADVNYKKNSFCYHKQLDKNHLDDSISESNLILENKTRLSEDLRLLYVAITRSIYHCSIGIGPVVHHKKTKKSHNHENNNHDLHHSALGYLIQKKKSGNAKKLRQHLKMLSICSNGDISFRVISQSQENLFNFSSIASTQPLLAKKWKSPKNIIPWSITSFSALKNTDATTICTNFQKRFIIRTNIQHQENNTFLTPHTFLRGKICGKFFHSIFEVLNFNKSVDIQWLYMQMEKYDINPIWGRVIQEWIYIIVNTPLNNENLTLAQIISKNKKTELKFYLPINTHLTSQELDSVCKHYDPLSYRSPPLTFTGIEGMLHGFIDLIFCWNEQYYLLDYKTNWLGKNNEFYAHSKIQQEMIRCNYALQYQFYALALHRFLRNRLISYNYEKNFGGIYYLFIRGMDGTPFSNGIYFFKPLLEFIDKLDALFSGK